MVVAFLNEVCVTRVERNEKVLDQISSKSLLSDQSELNDLGPIKDLLLNVFVFKGAIAVAAIAINFRGTTSD